MNLKEVMKIEKGNTLFVLCSVKYSQRMSPRFLLEIPEEP